jgi:hypothetical protein
MNEAEWLTCSEPDQLVAALGSGISERKLRLLLCALCRRAMAAPPHGFLSAPPPTRITKALEVAERYADCQATPKMLLDARSRAWEAVTSMGAQLHRLHRALPTAQQRLEHHVLAVVAMTIHTAKQELLGSSLTNMRSLLCDDTWLADLLREVFGNPFRPAKVGPAWSSWNGGAVLQLAREVYSHNSFDCLPVLADALEEAGCTDPDILSHCRSAGEHVRGCWILDLILGME